MNLKLSGMPCGQWRIDRCKIHIICTMADELCVGIE